MAEPDMRPIDNTYIRIEYGWDRMCDVDWDLLRNNLQAANRVLHHPDKYPHANFKAIERKADAIESFMRVHLKF